MARPDSIAVSLVKAAFDLHRKRLWLEISSNTPFLVRVPGEDHPLAAQITGQSGHDYGVTLVRGEHSVEHMAAILTSRSDHDPVFDSMTLVTLLPTSWSLQLVSREMLQFNAMRWVRAV